MKRGALCLSVGLMLAVALAGCGRARYSDAKINTTFTAYDCRRAFESTSSVLVPAPGSEAFALRARYIAVEIPRPKEVWALVGQSQVAAGMDSEQVWWAWGPPHMTYRHQSSRGEVVMWEWNRPGVSSYRTVTFLDGTVLHADFYTH